MELREALLPEFDMEIAKTRAALDRVPEDKFGWKPHEKSMTLDRLVGHIAEMPGWVAPTVDQDSLDVAPAGGPALQAAIAKSRQEALAMFDKNVAEGRAAITRASDENMMKTWTLLMGGKTMFSMPRIVVLRSMIMNHIIHHRAQLGVYLRLNDVPVPSTYGPSADEGKM
jgi:uncharacterized damage-inducible protein DinB